LRVLRAESVLLTSKKDTPKPRKSPAHPPRPLR
jgi:hypothetical protein